MARLVKEGLLHLQKHFLEMKFACLYVLEYVSALANSGKKNSLHIIEEIACYLIQIQPTHWLTSKVLTLSVYLVSWIFGNWNLGIGISRYIGQI